MKRETEHAFVPALAGIVALVDAERRRDRAGRRIHSNHSAARAFGHPEMIVGSQHDFPRHAQPARDDAEREGRLRGDGLKHDLRERGDDGELRIINV